MIDIDKALNRAEQLAEDRRLIQGGWHGSSSDGLELACALGSLDPSINSSMDCPATIQPLWMSEVIVWLFDRLSANQLLPAHREWIAAIRRARTAGLTKGDWRTIHRRWTARLLEKGLERRRNLLTTEPGWALVDSSLRWVIGELRHNISNVPAAAECANHAIRDGRMICPGDAMSDFWWADYTCHYAALIAVGKPAPFAPDGNPAAAKTSWSDLMSEIVATATAKGSLK